jgi:hypothetical protein|tara:strand:- start:827 stop:1063 length:237 start_codon:yes stop_codon:yes gene_type:complete
MSMFLQVIYWFAALGISIFTAYIIAKEILKRWRLNYRLEDNDATLLSDSSVKIEILTSAPEGSTFVDSVPGFLIEDSQ